MPGRLTLREHERLVRLAGWIPSFEKAAELFGEFLGIEVGKLTSQRYTEEAGARALQGDFGTPQQPAQEPPRRNPWRNFKHGKTLYQRTHEPQNLNLTR